VCVCVCVCVCVFSNTRSLFNQLYNMIRKWIFFFLRNFTWLACRGDTGRYISQLLSCALSCSRSWQITQTWTTRLWTCTGVHEWVDKHTWRRVVQVCVICHEREQERARERRWEKFYLARLQGRHRQVYFSVHTWPWGEMCRVSEHMDDIMKYIGRQNIWTRSYAETMWDILISYIYLRIWKCVGC